MNQSLPANADVMRGDDGTRSGYIRSLRAVALEVGSRAIRLSRLDDGARCVFVPDGRVAVGWRREAVPGETLRIRPRRVRSFGNIRFMTGELVDRGLDVASLGLTPLQLFGRGQWGPLVNADQAATTEGDGTADDAAAADRVVERDLLLELVQGTGPRPAFEMERVRCDGASDGNETSKPNGPDLRNLDWHARLGLNAFRGSARKDLALAIRHYRVGVAIGDLTVGEEFEGVLSWAHDGNRPFLRCLHGLGLCWWRLGEPERASEVFRRLLWLDPEDPLDARPLLKQLDLGFVWEQSYTAQSGSILAESFTGR